VECLLSKPKALSSKPNTANKEREAVLLNSEVRKPAITLTAQHYTRNLTSKPKQKDRGKKE
jgi:hypothetical protein